MEKIIEGLYIIKNVGVANVFVIGDKENYSLIDTGMENGTDYLIKELKENGFEPGRLSRIILSHYHPDHVGGLKKLMLLSAAVLEAHENDVDSITSVLCSCGCCRDKIDVELKDGDFIDLIGGLEVINVSGHTPGSIALYQRDKKIMFFGDVIKDIEGQGLCIGIPEHYNHDTQQTLKDGQKLLNYEIEIALFSHGEPVLKPDINKLYQLKT